MAEDPGDETAELAADDGGPTAELPAPDRAGPELAPAGADAPPRPRRRRRWLRGCLLALLLVVVAAGVALAVAFEPIARWYVLDQAARRGVRLTPAAITVGWGQASLERVRVELADVPDLALTVEQLDVSAEGLAPREVVARGVEARARSADAIRQLIAFGRAREGDLVPMHATAVRLVLGADGERAVLEARAASATLPRGGPARVEGAVIDVPRPRLVVGPVPLVVAASTGALDVWLGEDPAAAPLHVRADLEARVLSAQLAATPATTIGAWLGRAASDGPPPWPPRLAVEARGELRWTADPRGDLTGTVGATLHGVVPPHPPELAGIVFGDDTVVSTDLRVRASDVAIALPRLEVVAGSLRLAGSGSIAPRDGSFTATAELAGAIPCADLVGSAAVAHLGLPLGAGLGALARQGLAGSVQVRLGVTVDGDRPMQPVVRPSASIQCRLRLVP
jgi:hypothetical protein